MVPVSWLSYRPIKVSLVRLPREGGMVPDRLFPPMSSCWSKGSLERKGGTGPETPVLLMVRDRSFFSFVSWGGMGPTRAGGRRTRWYRGPRGLLQPPGSSR
ncbi:polygalacturonase inhibitor-like [Iris pallida]|uniref:Polygalacturonase inhibitor-like n=1 Tax=Iris pallida TaxID=29817 RepID=A0AAX6GBQ1_IRIPA|nr:polygalacturonase inhibitor-like [Iris pallida]